MTFFSVALQDRTKILKIGQSAEVLVRIKKLSWSIEPEELDKRLLVPLSEQVR